MRLTGEDARRWLEQNPNASFIDNRTGQRTDAQQGGFMRFLQSVTRPIRTFIPAAQEFGRTMGDIGRFARGEELSQAPETYFGMTREESEQFARDPLQRGVKAGAALGAYGVPMGGGQAASTLGRIGTAAGRGAVAGTMSGFGYSDEGEELKSTLRGGALGGLIGGATQGIGEASRAIKAKKAMSKVTDRNIRDLGARGTTIDDVGGWDKYKSKGKTFYNEADRLGLPVGDRFQRSDALNAILGENADEVATILQNSPDQSVSFKKVVDKLNNNQKLKLAGLDEKKFVDTLKEVLLSQGDEVSAPMAKQVIEQLDDIAGGFSRISGDVTAQRGQIIKEFRNALRTELGTQIPAVNVPLRVQSDLLDIAGDIYRQTSKDVPVGVPILGLKLKGPTVTKAVDRLGSAAQNVATSGVQLPQGLGNLVQGGAGVAQRATPAIVGAAQSLPGRQPEVTDPQMQQMPGTQQMPQQQGPQIDQMALIEAVLSGQLSTSEADWLMNMLGSQGGAEQMPTTESGRKFWFAKESANNILRMLETTGPLAGPLQGIRTGLTSAVGIADEQTALKNEIEAMRSIVFNALGGAQLTPNEQKQYEKFIPKVTDTKAQVRQKLQTLIPKLQGLMGVSSQEDLAINQILGL